MDHGQIKLIIFDFNWTLFDDGKKELFPDAVPLLEELSEKYKLAILAKGGDERRERIRSLGIEKYFDMIEVIPEKCADDYRRMIDNPGVLPAETLVVGDRAWKDVRFGNESGACTVWVRRGKFADEMPREDIEEADYVVSGLEDVSSVLKIVENREN